MRCYDALIYDNKPDLGIDPCYVVYGMHDGKGNPRQYTDEQLTGIIRAARGQIVCFDQEIFGHHMDPMHARKGWNGVTPESHENAKRWFRDFAQRVRSLPGGSGLRFGYYGIGGSIYHPHRGNYRIRDVAAYKYTRDDANRIQDTGITDLVDVLMPAYYVRSRIDTHPAEIAEEIAITASVFERPICPFVYGYKVTGSQEKLGPKWQADFIEAIRPYHDDWRLEALILWGGYKQTWDNPDWVGSFLAA